MFYCRLASLSATLAFAMQLFFTIFPHHSFIVSPRGHRPHVISRGCVPHFVSSSYFDHLPCLISSSSIVSVSTSPRALCSLDLFLSCLLLWWLCSEKNTHTHFLSYLHELFVDLNKNCSEHTQELVDSNNIKIRYLLRSMT